MKNTLNKTGIIYKYHGGFIQGREVEPRNTYGKNIQKKPDTTFYKQIQIFSFLYSLIQSTSTNDSLGFSKNNAIHSRAQTKAQGGHFLLFSSFPSLPLQKSISIQKSDKYFCIKPEVFKSSISSLYYSNKTKDTMNKLTIGK